MERTTGRTEPHTSLRVLVVHDDALLFDECREAFGQIADRTAVLFQARIWREAMEVARDRQPHFVIAAPDAGHDLPVLIREFADIVPDAAVAIAHDLQGTAAGTETAAVIDWMRAGARDFLRRPVSRVELSDVLDRLFMPRGAAAPSASGVVVSFVSNKGGVGKSTLSVNVACALAQRHPGQVLLIDASLQLGVCALMLGVTPAATILDAARERDRLDETLLRGLTTPHPCGVRLLGAPADALEAADVSDETFARILHVARRAFAYVIVDTFPLLDSVVMAALDASDLVALVFQATAPSVAGMARLLPVLEGLGFQTDRQIVVMNRNHRRFLGDLGVSDAAAGLGRAIDVVVPYDRGVLVSMNTGEPYALRAMRWRGFARAVNGLAARIVAVQAERAALALDSDADVRRRRTESERRGGRDRRRLQGTYTGTERRSGVDRRLAAAGAAAGAGGMEP